MKSGIGLAILAATITFSTPLLAGDSFKDRVGSAKSVERSPEGRTFLMQYMPALNSQLELALGKCFPQIIAGTVVRFELVADITSNGTISNVAISPDGARENCYAKLIDGAQGPIPSLGRPVPIYVETEIKY